MPRAEAALPSTRLFEWWYHGTPEARRALIAAALGWMLDSFDVMLYALVLASIIPDLGISKETAGLLGSATLVASAVGGIVFGIVADRYGRTRALMGTIAIFSLASKAPDEEASGCRRPPFECGRVR